MDRAGSNSRGIMRADDRRQRVGDANRAQPCIDPTSLLREIEQHWRLNSLGELVAYANQRGDCDHPAPEFASLAPIVARCAEHGDALAAEVLTRAGVELAELVALVFRKMAVHTRVPHR